MPSKKMPVFWPRRQDPVDRDLLLYQPTLEEEIRDCAGRREELGLEYATVSTVDDPFQTPYTWRLATPLNADKMAQAALRVVGRHDFASFKAEGTEVRDTVRVMTAARVFEPAPGEVWFEISGKGFLYNMVRILAGTLLLVGRRKFPPEAMKEIIEAKDREAAGKTAAAKGLCLVRVDYPEEAFLFR